MNRPREYKKEDVLEAATGLFWAKGFEATSISELVELTGLNKHSMYREFGDKEGLFLASLDHYAKESNKELGEVLTRKPLGLSNLEAFFDNRVEYAASPGCKGCLLVNSVTEDEILSDKINDKIQKMLTMQEGLFYDCLLAAKDKGEISKNKDCKVLASYLSCFLRGLINFGRSDTNKATLRKMTEVALMAIKN